MIEFEQFNESISNNSGPDLTPLIDMVFLLLIFFLLTSSISRPIIPVQLPDAEKTELNTVPEITITINKDQSLRVNGN